MKNKNIKILGLFLSLGFLVVLIITKGINFFGSNREDFIEIPLSEITEEVKFYEYNFDGKKIRFFAVKAKDGTIKTAFDACDVCYQYKKGYRQERDYMVCNNCGNRYPISSLGTENKNPGGCWPGYLPNLIKGNNVFLKKSDLENNRWRAL